MNNIEIARTGVNVEALDADLRAALGESVHGISTRRGVVIVHLQDSARMAEIDQVQQIVADHDASQLTARQQAEIDRQQKLAQLRAANVDAIDTSVYSGENQLIQSLAEKVAWLELELRNLRGDA